MKRFIFLAVAVIFMGAGCNATQTAVTQPAPQVSAPSPSDTTQKSPAANTISATVAVSIQNFSFSPTSINAKKGDKIVFTNNDSVQHTVTADGGAFSSPSLANGQSFTLDTSSLAAGSYGFHCSIHPSMQGTITVQQ